jgi:hypothetical protein
MTPLYRNILIAAVAFFLAVALIYMFGGFSPTTSAPPAAPATTPAPTQ